MKQIMRVVSVLLALVAIAGERVSPCKAEGEISVSDIARTRALDLHLIPADIDHLWGDRWIVWDERSKDIATTHIQLCNLAGECRWSHIWRDAYDPTIQLMGRWSGDHDGGANIFLLTYQEGAAAETAVVIGYIPNKPAVIYDQRDGALISVAPDRNTIEIDLSSGPEQDVDCFGWNSAAMRLAPVKCWRGTR